MPLTFLSHQAVVLPLKIVAPSRTSGTALVLGSMAPDVEYFVRTYPTATISHTWPGLVTFCLPVALVLFWIITRVVAEPLAHHLPSGGEFRLSEYALLREQPNTLRQWGVVAASALAGSASHLVLDRLSGFWSTLPLGEPTSWLPRETLPSSEAWIIAKLATWIVLALVTVVLLRQIGRRRLLRQWAADRRSRGASVDSTGSARPQKPDGIMEPVALSHGLGVRHGAPATARSFWIVVAAGAIIAGMLGALHRRSGFFLHQPATWVHIGLCAISGAFIGLVLASVVWQRQMRNALQHRGDHR